MPLKRTFDLLNNHELALIARRVKPVVQTAQGLFFISPIDLRAAFNKNPVLLKPAALTPLTTIPTLHRWKNPDIFTPTCVDILSQIPPNILDDVTAFSTEPLSSKTGKLVTGDNNYHQGMTTFYTGDLPRSVRIQRVILSAAPK